MSEYRLILSFPAKNISKLKKIFPEDKIILWLYLGKDFFKRRFLDQALGERFSRIDIARLHEEVAKDMRQEYVHWIDDLNRRYGKNIEWWFGSISSRNIYYSDLFQYCCYLEIIERLWREGRETPKLIVIESPGLAQAIKKCSERRNINAEIINYSWLNHRAVSCYLTPFLSYLEFSVTLLLRWIVAHITRLKYGSKDLKIKPSVIVDTYILDNCVSENGEFKDRYFPYLYEYLSSKNLHIFVHPVLYGFGFNYYSIYQRMRRSNRLFIIREDYLNVLDYFYALIYPVKVVFWQEIEKLPFRNFDVSDLLEEDHTKSITYNLQSILIYRLFLRLGKAGLQPDLIIDWYENQVIDKALIAGARRAFPYIKIIGVQQFLHSLNDLNLFPSQSEVEAGIVPDILFETSQYQCTVAQTFTKEIPCKSVAALRYSHIFDNESILDNGIYQKSDTIFIFLSFNLDDAVELLATVKEGLNQINNYIRLLIKCHPICNSKDLVKSFGEKDWPDRFEIFNGNIQEALNQASIVISSGSSSIVEAASKGIPVIFVGRQTVLNQNILSNLSMDIVTECFSTAELIRAINKYLNMGQEEKKKYREMGKKVRNLFFEPVNEKTMSPFISIIKR